MILIRATPYRVKKGMFCGIARIVVVLSFHGYMSTSICMQNGVRGVSNRNQ